ncbi:hypothetical protein LSTR_LSTR004384 [Laodelphax striatellus]|uniref:PHD-type domain-containing protein n=1 Tax=Laodelphax striatellus TaxID=195883 RepID=A0A482X8F2_LAOST|nr:hypothetical protein LSTR_LSTR004384 [Laodelphax striatellus]
MKEMVGGCCVCSDDRGWTENPLVYCDGQMCTVAVHQACYGIVTVPTGNWYCRKCESQERTARVRCELCPSKDGALKRTDNNGWAHVVCALYIPEVRFGNVTTMEPILLQQIPPERFNKVCYICEESNRGTRSTIGACMQCNKSGCKQQFHVTCAQALGLLCEEAGNYLDNVKYCGYCQHHYSKLKKSGNVKTIPPYRPIPSENASDCSSPEKEPGENWAKTTAKRKLSSGSKFQSGSTQNSTGVKGASPSAIDDESNCSSNTTNSGLTSVVHNQSSQGNMASIKTENSTASNAKYAANFNDNTNSNEGSLASEPVKGSNKKRKSFKEEANAPVNSNSSDDALKKIKTEPSSQDGSFQSASVVVKIGANNSTTSGAANVSNTASAATASRIVTSTATPVTTTGSIVVSVPLPVPFAGLPTPTTNSSASPQPTTTVAVSSSSPASSATSEDPPSKRGRSQSLEKVERGRSRKRGGGAGSKRGGRGSLASPPPVSPVQVTAPVTPVTSTPTTSLSTISTSPSAVVTTASFTASSATNVTSSAASSSSAVQPARFQNGVNAPHMLGNQLNPSSTMAQKMSDTLNQELEAHSIFTNDNSSQPTSNLVGPQLHSRVIASVRSSNPATPNSNNASNGSTSSSGGGGGGGGGGGSSMSAGGLNWGTGQGTVPQSLDQLLERQWEQGSQFLMEQAQHFDIASLLSCLHQLRAENLRLEEHVNGLSQRRDHLLAVNARLAIPLTQMNNVHPSAVGSNAQPLAAEAPPPPGGRTSASGRVNSAYPPPGPMENGLPPSPPTTQHYRGSTASQPSPSTISRHHSSGNSAYVSSTPGVVVPRGGLNVQPPVSNETHRGSDSRRSSAQTSAVQQAPSYASMYQVSSQQQQQQQQQMVMRRELVTADMHHQIPPSSKPS